MTRSAERGSERKPPGVLVANAVVAVLYAAAGQFGHLMAMTDNLAATVWPSAGIALGAVLCWGYRVWPGVVIGSVFANVGVHFHVHLSADGMRDLVVALTIGAGAAAQACAAAYLVLRFVGFPNRLDDEWAVGKFLTLAGPVGSVVSATVALGALATADRIPVAQLGPLWSIWWLGDTIGAITCAPLFVMWAVPGEAWRRRRRLGILPLGVAFALVTALVVRTSGWQQGVLAVALLFVVLLEAFLLSTTGRAAHVEELVAQRTRELEVLLRELQHRVKNNLQVIASLFSLQARYLRDARYREIFEESRNRVLSIALVHENLYQSKDLSRIDFAEYVRRLVDHLRGAFGAGDAVSLETDIRPLTLPVDLAIPCGLVINELVTNAFKHAFPDGRRGTIRVALGELAPARCRVAVEDDGVGLPAEVDLGKTESLGLDLVSILTAQLGAAVEVSRLRGTSFQFSFAGAGP